MKTVKINDWRRNDWRLSVVPLFYSSINAWFQCGLKLPITRSLVELMPPILIAKTQQPSGAAYFFLAITFSTLTSS